MAASKKMPLQTASEKNPGKEVCMEFILFNERLETDKNLYRIGREKMGIDSEGFKRMKVDGYYLSVCIYLSESISNRAVARLLETSLPQPIPQKCGMKGGE
ncbi:MAG: hypothetical protein ACPL28_11040 [bacterium]